MGSVRDALKVEPNPMMVEKVRPAMLEVAQQAEMSLLRTEEQTKQLAERDSQLMCAVAEYNKSADSFKKSVLGQRAYILSSATRYRRVAKKVGVVAEVATRPHILIALLELIEPSPIGDRQFLALLENPLLQGSVAICWEKIKILLDAGIELKDKSMTRLRHDVENALDVQIAGLREADRVAGDSDEADPEAGDKEHVALLERAESLGYRSTRLLSKLKEDGKLKAGQLARLAAENEDLRLAVARFGAKKARWLRRLDRQKRRG